jgi:UDP-glucose 4-epimerase
MACPQARGEIVNVGNDEEVTIQQLAERVREQAGSSSDVVLIPYERAYGEGFDDMRRRVPDLRKAARLVDYRPTRLLHTILDDVIAYETQQIETSGPGK